MHRVTVDRDRLLDILTRTIEALERPLPIDEALEELRAPIVAIDGSAADAMAGVLEDAHEFMLRDITLAADAEHVAEATRIPSFQNVPYIPSHKGLSLFQSALDEFLESGPVAEEEFDPSDPHWLGVAWEKLKTFFRGKHPFTRHQHVTDFVEPLADTVRVALVADWGTGTQHARRVMQQITATQPTHVIHLGDVYYSGTEREVRTRFLDVIDELGPPAPCVYRALNSNHEMYSGGYAYFDLTLPRFGQDASYFNLRSTRWQLIGLDSGHEDHGLRDPQREWLEAQLNAADNRRTILLTHHQLFSAFDDRPKGKKLGKKVTPLLPEVFAWIWGHEHKCVLYGPHLGIHGRCIGHGAIPFHVPFGSPENVPVILADERPEGGAGSSGIHGFALLTLDGPNATLKYIDEFGRTFTEETLA